MLKSIQKARSWGSRQGRAQPGQAVPRAFGVPPGGYGYYGQGHHYAQVLNFTAWAFIAIHALIKEIAGGKGPNVGSVRPRDDERDPIKRRLRSKSWRASVSKTLNGPEEHEEFEPWDREHPGRKLFSNPNGPDVPYDLWAYHTLFYYLTGEAHWWLIRDYMGVPREVWVIPTHWMRRITDSDGQHVAWMIQNPWGATQYALAQDVVSFKMHSPLNRWEGYSVTTACGRWLDIYDSVMTVQLATFKNGATPALHVELDESYPNPDDAVLRRYYAKWFERFQGEHNAGLPVVTGPGVKVTTIGSTPNEIGFEASEEAIRNRVLAAYGVPQALVTGDPTVDTSAYAPQRTFCRFTVNPHLTYVGQVITEKVLRPRWKDALCWWDDRVPDDPKQTLDEIRALKEIYGITPNEARAKLGYEPFPHGGDDPIGQDGMPLGWVSGRQRQTTEQVDLAYQQALHAKDGDRINGWHLDKALSSMAGADGGYLVPPQLSMRDLKERERELRDRHKQVVNRMHAKLNEAAKTLPGEQGIAARKVLNGYH